MTVADPAGDAPAAGDRDGLPRRGFRCLAEQGPGLLEGPVPPQSPCLQPLTPVRAHLRQGMTSSSDAENPRFGFYMADVPFGRLHAYRLPNHHGRDSMALVASGVTDAAARLSALVGPVAKLDGKPVDELHQPEPGACEPEFEDIVDAAVPVLEPPSHIEPEQVADPAPPTVPPPVTLSDAEPVMIEGHEIGRTMQGGEFVPAASYWAFDGFSRFRRPMAGTPAGDQMLMAALIRAGTARPACNGMDGPWPDDADDGDILDISDDGVYYRRDFDHDVVDFGS